VRDPASPTPAATPATASATARGDLLLALVVAISRAPFLGAGYGTDTDAWKLAFAAREIATTGHYTPSRLPGYPVQEYASALLWRGGPIALNGLTALWSVLAAILFLRLWRRLGGRDGALAALAFAFAPAVFIGSVSAMDYLWAEAFVLGATFLALAGRAAACGFLLGMATGCRITSAALGLPLALLLGASVARGRVARVATLAGVAAGVAALCYLPVYLRIGPGFLSYYEPQGAQRSIGDFIAGIFHPGRAPFSPTLIVGQATAGVFGPLGAAGLALAVLAALAIRLRRGAGGAPPALALPRGLAAGMIAGVLVPLVLYVRLPHDEAYLIPAIPFALVLFAALAPRTILRAGLATLVIAPFLLGVDVVPPKKGLTPPARSPLARTFALAHETVVVDPLRGPLLLDTDKRRRALAVATRTLPELGRLDPDGLLLAGVLHPVLYYFAPDSPRHPVYADVLGPAALADSLRRGRQVYYLPDVRARSLRMAGFDPREAGARPLFPDDDPAPAAAVRALPPRRGG